MPDEEHIFGLVRFSVPANWSDWGVDQLVARIVAEEPDEHIMPRGLTARIVAEEPDEHIMPRGLTYEERQEFHHTFERKK